MVRPYLQLGDVPRGHRPRTSGCSGRPRTWTRTGPRVPAGCARASWRPADAPALRRVAVPGVAAHRVYRADLEGTGAGRRVSPTGSGAGSEVVFTAGGHAPRAAPVSPIASRSSATARRARAEQKAVAYQAYQARPDFVLIAGDIVYTRGRISRVPREVLAGVQRGRRDRRRPVRRCCARRSFVAAPGNHDIAARDLGKYPDGLAYFLYWDQPLNGPIGREGGRSPRPCSGPRRPGRRSCERPGRPIPAWRTSRSTTATPTGRSSTRILTLTGPTRTSAAWVERDLAAAQGRHLAVRRLPPSRRSTPRRAHFGDQRMRVLAEVFEAGRVDVVWSGHVHNYQRTYPLDLPRPIAGPTASRSVRPRRSPADGRSTRSFDGRDHTRPAASST